MCDRVIWLDQGRIRFDGPSADRRKKLYLSTVPSVANFRRGEDLIQLALEDHRAK
jgi:ABC-type multidrug transport system ATPase subunit